MNNFRPSKKITFLIVVVILVIAVAGIHRYQSTIVKSISIVDAEYVAPETILESSLSSLVPWEYYSTATSSLTGYRESVSKQVAKELYANSTYLSQDGELSDAEQKILADSLVAKIEKSLDYKEYKQSGLRIISDENKEKDKIYGTQVAAFQIEMLSAMKKKQKEIVKDLSILADIYDIQAKYLYAVEVPRELVGPHLQIVNNYSISASALRTVVDFKSDPVLVPIALRAHQSAAYSQTSSLQKIADFLKANGIIYKTNEAGGYWNIFYIKQ